METKTFTIGGMSCVNCQNKIEKALRSVSGVESADVSYKSGTAVITFDADLLSVTEINARIEKLGYQVLDGTQRGTTLSEIGGYVVLVIALWLLVQHTGLSSLSSAFPLAEAGMNYGMLFIIGLITSVHCLAMCGGINLSQCLGNRGYDANYSDTPVISLGSNEEYQSKTSFPVPRSPFPSLLLPSILYNGGRVVSYTIVGALVGALGSVFTISGSLQGIVQIIAGVFMVVMGINMLGFFPALRKLNIPMPKLFAKRIEAEKEKHGNPLLIGLLNGLMPCGPLQAMQLYALSTGSPIAGAVSMFLFSAGTVPLMFAFGAVSSLLSKRFTARVMKAGAILVAVLGLTMFTNGWSLGGLPNPLDSMSAVFAKGERGGGGANGEVFQAKIVDGVQVVNSTLSGGRYPAITVQQGIPVKWTINAPQGSINGCNNRMIIREYGIEHRFTMGENKIEFTPEKTGRFPYSCWMGMIRSSITVVEAGAAVAADTVDSNDDIFKPSQAGVTIPADEIARAEYHDEGYQTVRINLRDDGFSPSVIAVEKNVPAIWVINNHSLEEGNSELVFPAYYAKIPMKDGDNSIQLMPSSDFDFSTADNVYYGFVKVVDDINDIDA
ncbi:MAG: sulfite exporter TauE/SafE family protein, partial [Spirochaetaceae bacterium]|nr:sulfite exporter TauE/SafE family protein [Spirochaetaceae bacterium]